MDRRDFLRTTGSLAAAAAAVTPAVANQNAPAAAAVISSVKELGMAFDWPDNDQGLADSARRLAQRIFDATEGRIRVVPRFANDAASAELRHGMAHDHVAHNPAFAYFAGLPGEAGLLASDIETWINMAGGQALWDELAGERGVKSLLSGHSGHAPSLWSAAPIEKIQDVQGKRFASLGLGAEVLRGLGAEPVELKSKNAAAALADGRVDGLEWGSTMHAHVLGVPAVAKHATGPFINSAGTAQAIDIKLEIWTSFCKADQAAIAAAASDEFRLTQSEARFNEAMARKVAITRHGTTFTTLNVDLASAINSVSEAVVAHVAGSNRTAGKINASYMAFRALLPAGNAPIA